MAITKEEEKTLKSIVVTSENNPPKPDFPPKNPKFSATQTYKINIPDFTDVWLKDERL